MQMEAMAEEILELADQADAETYNAQRLKVDTRKWLMSKLAPKKYGDKPPDVNVGVNVGLQLVHSVPRPERIEDASIQCSDTAKPVAGQLDSSDI